MRAMRLEKREMKEPEELNALLQECRVIRIGISDGEGIYIVPLNYGYEWENLGRGGEPLKFYIHSAKEGRKAEAFLKNPKVSFELDFEGGIIQGDYSCSYSYAYRSIMGQGRLKRLEDSKEKERGLSVLMRHMAPGAKLSFSEAMLQAADVYCLEAEWFTGKERRQKEKNPKGA